MKDKEPFFSLITTFRNRKESIEQGLKRIERHLDSIQKQTYQNFELVFVNNGSEEEFSQVLEKLVSKYQFLRYIYTETRGFDWNKPHALNIALNFIIGKQVIINDADLIYPSDFLTKVLEEWNYQEILVYHFYYLPPNFRQYTYLQTRSDKLQKRLDSSQRTACGTIILQKKVFEDVGGYDEFYRVWGVEDWDFLEMATFKGHTYRFWDKNRPYVFHQWHKKESTPVISDFYKVMQQHFVAKKQGKISNQSLLELTKAQQPLSLADRPTLERVLYHNLINILQFNFEVPKDHTFLRFIKQFNTLKSGEYLLVQQEFVEFGNNTSKLKKWIKLINQLLKKIKISYRFVEIGRFQNNKLEWEEVQNFLRYFTVHFSEYLEDYYFKCEYPKVFLLLLKK